MGDTHDGLSGDLTGELYDSSQGLPSDAPGGVAMENPVIGVFDEGSFLNSI